MRSATGFALGALCPNHNKFVCKPLESLVLGTFRACSISKIDFCTVRTLNLHWCLLNLKLPRYLCMYVHPSNNSLSFIRIRRKCLFFLNKKKLFAHMNLLHSRSMCVLTFKDAQRMDKV